MAPLPDFEISVSLHSRSSALPVVREPGSHLPHCCLSPVLVKRLTDDFVRKINRFAEASAVPVVHFEKGDCKEAIAQTKLEHNGFFACDDPDALQEICDGFGVAHIEAFFRKWLRRLPHPFTAEDRKAEFRYELSILQLEMSTTQVFDKPLSGRLFFEQVIRENLDIGRPDRVSLIFDRRITRRTPGRFRTRVSTAGVTPSLRFDYKATRVKQYFKLERALRTETTINNAKDFRVGKRLCNLDRLRTIGRNVHHRLLSLECVAQHCAIASQTVERVVLPTVDEHRAPALRWGDPRAMALLHQAPSGGPGGPARKSSTRS